MATAEATSTVPNIVLYTNHQCPYAHRVHIILRELDLPFEEELIDLSTPRPSWYLKINPRGLVPSMKFSCGPVQDQVLTESAVVTDFLNDCYPSHLLPQSSGDPQKALFRARVSFFADTWKSTVSSQLIAMIKLDDGPEKEAKCLEWASKICEEIEPLLEDAAPFFGGSQRMTMAEVQVAPFLVRTLAYCKGGLLPASFEESITALPNLSRWMEAVVACESVAYIYDAEENVKQTHTRVAALKAAGKGEIAVGLGAKVEVDEET